MKTSATTLRAKNRKPDLKDKQSALATWQAIASISASIAIPIILAVFGYQVQRQLATEGLKKDYVQIATNILKENPAGQEKELRTWAVDVLDRNAEIPFSKNAKVSLEKGFPLVRSHFIFPDPPEPCMMPPEKLMFLPLIDSTNKNGFIDIGDEKKFLLKLIREAEKSELIANRLNCLQGWLTKVKTSTDEFNASEYGLTPRMKPSAVIDSTKK